MKKRYQLLLMFALFGFSNVVAAQDNALSPSTRAPQLSDPNAPGETGEKKEPVFEPPKLSDYIQANYPKEAMAVGLEGTVIAELSVDENGLVSEVRITEPAGNGFDAPAEEAMYQFVFAPAKRDGIPIPSKVVYRYTFFLKKEKPVANETAPPAPTSSFSGRVLDVDGKPMPGVSVVMTAVRMEGPKGSDPQTSSAELPPLPPSPDPVVTGNQGGFAFAAIDVGSFQVDVISPGMKPFNVIETLEADEIREVIYRLEAEDALYETFVRGKRPPREVTRREITRREITRIPGTGGDALRSIQNMPGMARAPGFSGALIVRGSSPNDTSIYFDQMPVPLLYHFGGLTSVINSDLIEQIDFFPGNYGLRYGGATGGIVDVYPKTPETTRFRAYVDADFWDIGALVETPITKNWSVAVSARRSYIDGLLNATLPEDGGLEFTLAPRYYDYQLVANYHPNPKDELQIFLFGSDDRLKLVFGGDVADNPNIAGNLNFAIYFHQLQARWDHKLSKKINNRIALGTGNIRSNTSFGTLFAIVARKVPVYLRDELTFDIDDTLTMRLGIDSAFDWSEWLVRAPQVIPGEGQNQDPLTDDQVILETKGEDNSYRMGGYAETEFRPVKGLRLLTGLRFDYWEILQRMSIDPRMVLRYEILDGTILKGGVGMFHQRPQDYEIDEVFGNTALDLIQANHYSLGVEQRVLPQVELSVEGFYKKLSKLVVSSQDLVMRNGELVPERFNNQGVGSVYGLEVLLKHFPTDRLFGWISYTLMKSRRVDHPGDKERLFDFDQTHILTMVASTKIGRGWEAGVRYRLVTGNPNTPIVDSFYNSDADIYLPVYGEVNSTRMPTFHQLDLRIDKSWQWKRVKMAIYVDVQNVYNQKNPEGFQYNYDFTQRQYFNGLPVIPSLGLKLEY